MIQKLLQVRLPIRDKTDFVRDLESRGFTQRQVIQHLIDRELLRIRQGQPPSYAGELNRQA